ncbi:hypothetical protein [Paenibacillus ginsengarvi]|uniref:Uncharacterized protein n=1 Tax=Paenibacillus ginsengarvi TaxID=400777 RepID=A0A3B0CH23_9BACL|nr:hypothetical protein [Paenibacillus ginsengarvi]RKN84118.1 hypothetical protein D7M11_13990 [Paenibacillus ginsengarvi]
MSLLDSLGIKSGQMVRTDNSIANEADGINEDGSQNVRIVGSKTVDLTFHDGAAAAGTGTIFNVGGCKTVTIEITGTSTSRKIVFEGASISGTYYPIMGVRLSDMFLGTQTTGINEVWQFDATGLVNFRARLSDVAGGNVTVKGRAVV